MDATKLLEYLGRSMGAEDLVFNTQGCASLLFDNRIALNLESDREAGRLHLYIELGALPSHGRERVYRTLLEGNLYGVQTGESALAVDPVTEAVVLCRSLWSEEASGTAFVEIVRTMVSCADVWQRALANGSLDGAPLAAAATGVHGTNHDAEHGPMVRV
ncbi:MAG: type III secretion system chaperone [Haliea sp.]|jgi:hypothetical protein|nr:type III secretion system chaperone [Haliea sp.]